MQVNGNAQEDMKHCLAAGAGVDDDNEPAPENYARISNSSNNTRECQHEHQTGEMPGMCPRLASGHRYENPKMDVPLKEDKRITYFLNLLPVTHDKNTIAPETNKHLHQPLSFG